MSKDIFSQGLQDWQNPALGSCPQVQAPVLFKKKMKLTLKIEVLTECRLKEAKTLSFEDDEAKAKAHRGIEFDNWIKEFQEVREIIMDAEPSSTFTHNDLLAGNVLVPNEVNLIGLTHCDSSLCLPV